MRFRALIATLGVASFCGVPLFAQAEAPLLQGYLEFYKGINSAELFEKQGDYAKAADGFKVWYAQLEKIHESNPDWEASLVFHRLEDCKAKILDLTQKAETASEHPTASGDFKFATGRTGKKTVYRWRENVLTSLFWIGEAAVPASAWNQNWRKSNDGEDSPYNRNGFAAATHASMVNPFYVALPFNDLAHPEMARQWMPAAWKPRVINGKTGSTCQDRWVWIKNSSGRPCFAQWEDVGPGGTDRAEYVFGHGKLAPTDGPGISVSPAVADYLGTQNDKSAVVSWRFVDDEDVPPGQWLKYDEQALIYRAMRIQKEKIDTKDAKPTAALKLRESIGG